MNPISRPVFSSWHKQRGLSLVELMVGMVIGLIGTVIIAAAIVANEDFKRSTVGANEAQINGALSLYGIERDLRMAGFGIANTNALGCASVSYTRSGYAGGYPAFGLRPVVITDGGTTASDTVQIVYSSEASRSLPATLAANMTAGATTATMNDATGYTASATARGDLVVLVSGTTCTLLQVTAANTATSVLTFGASAPFNSGTTVGAFASGAYAFNLGLPAVRTFLIGTNQTFQMLDVFQSTATNVAPTVTAGAIVIASGVVDLQADYGKDTNADGVIDVYNTTAPVTAADWAQVIAVRVAVLVRSSQYFRPATAGGACTATTAAPSWSGGTFYMSDSLPSCYKYRSFETVVPLRNMIWKEA